MQKSILKVEDYFQEEPVDYAESWKQIFLDIDITLEEQEEDAIQHPVMQQLLNAFHASSRQALVPYDESHIAEPAESILPAQQLHVEGSDNVVLGNHSRHTEILHPEFSSARGNPLYEVTAGILCAFVATSPPVKKKASDPTPAARPIWLAECLEVDLTTEKGLFRWYRTKISTSDWTKSGWVEDDKYTYGIGKAIINGRIGEWLGLDTVLVWGFKLNPHPATNPKSTLYAYDVNDMRAEARDRNLMWD